MDATQLFCVLCDTKEFSDVQFEDALSLLDEPSRQRARKFYQRDDAWSKRAIICAIEAERSRIHPRKMPTRGHIISFPPSPSDFQRDCSGKAVSSRSTLSSPDSIV